MIFKTLTQQTWPNFFIVGAQKAGSTSLLKYLESTPGIFIGKRGSNYFCSNSVPHNSKLNVVRDKRKYLELFSGVQDEKAIGEVCTTYMLSPEACIRIKETVPGARIIMILRDPIQRAFSQYLMNLAVGTETLPFLEALREDYYRRSKPLGIAFLYVEQGLYSNQVKRYFDTFGRDKVKVLIFEEFTNDTRSGVKEILSFLGVDADPPESILKPYNTFFASNNKLYKWLVKRMAFKTLSRITPETSLKAFVRAQMLKTSVEKPRMTEQAKLFLESLYKEDIENLSSILERPLPWESV